MIEDLLRRNKAWSAERKAEKADYFERLSQLQQPEIMTANTNTAK